MNNNRPASFSIFDHHTLYNCTDAQGVQRGTMGTESKEYADLWAKFRTSFQAGVDYMNSIGGGSLTMNVGRQEAMISKEQWEGI